jgi:DNA-binding MarR family transcriptional regulator
MKDVIAGRFGFLVSEVGRLYAMRFDRAAQARLRLSQTQCRVLVTLARSEEPLSQAELAQQIGLTPMAVAKLCDRMADAGWLERRPHDTDKRINRLHMKQGARKALERTLELGDELTAQALSGLTATEKRQLLDLLARVRANLVSAAPEA